MDVLGDSDPGICVGGGLVGVLAATIQRVVKKKILWRSMGEDREEDGFRRLDMWDKHKKLECGSSV